MVSTTKVSIIRCEDYDKEKIFSALDQTFEFFGGIDNIINKGAKVLLKPNFLKESHPEDCAVTHPCIIEAIAEKLLEFGATPIIGDSPAFGAVSKIARRLKLDTFAEKHGIDIIELDNARRVKAKCGERTFHLTVSGKALDVDAIINIPKLKAHVQLLYTAAVKNMYGCVSGKRKVWRHFQSNNNIRWYTEMLLANYHGVKPSFTIVDAVMAMEERGPSGGIPKNVSLLIAGEDCIAIDRVIAEVIGIPPSHVPILQTAKLHNIGEQDLNRIEIQGESLSAVKVDDFRLPELTPVGFGFLRVVKSLFKHLWMKNFEKTALLFFPFILMLPFNAFSEDEKVTRLKHFPSKVEADDIVHVPTGQIMKFNDLSKFFDAASILYVGEVHAMKATHEAQLKVLQVCYEKYGENLAIGMEMFTKPYQPFLDQWVAGEIDEGKFLEYTDWDKQWGFDYYLYKDILDFAREKKISVRALNAPKEMVKMVSEKGLVSLTEEEKAELPEIDTTGFFHRVYLQEVIGGHLHGKENLEKYNNVQCLWEEYMAQSIVDYLSSWEGKGKKMLVFVGNGHIIYDIGIPSRVFRRTLLPYYTFYPTVISEGIPGEGHHMFLPSIPLEPADFIWVVSTTTTQSKRIYLGVHIEYREDKKLIIQKLSEGGPAEKAGLMEGDIILSVDGKTLSTVGELVHYLQTKQFGDSCTVNINRDGTKITYAVTLFEMK
ncbi:MAG: DUF362 domain-containing protein [Candidatus Kuenenia sp.]|nr:DUF362 domain-containing protein [Candidatus Kuenenia hertensis]